MSALTPSSSAEILQFPTPAAHPEQYLKLRHALWESPAFRDEVACAIYVHMACRHNGGNNGQIPYTVRDAVRQFHIGKDVARRGIALLEEHQLAVCTYRGSNRFKSSTWWLPELGDSVPKQVHKRTYTGTLDAHSVPKQVRSNIGKKNRSVDGANSSGGDSKKSAGKNSSGATKKNGHAVTFVGQVVKPTAEQLQAWQRAYSAIDVQAELQAIDDWCVSRAFKSDWVSFASKWLRDEHTKRRSAAKAVEDDDSF
jgi:hypothetical protein